MHISYEERVIDLCVL